MSICWLPSLPCCYHWQKERRICPPAESSGQAKLVQQRLCLLDYSYLNVTSASWSSPKRMWQRRPLLTTLLACNYLRLWLSRGSWDASWVIWSSKRVKPAGPPLDIKPERCSMGEETTDRVWREKGSSQRSTFQIQWAAEHGLTSR